MDLSVLERVRLFPVRHHSPRAAATLSAYLDEVRPRLVLVEGPADATSLIPALVDAGTRPPVAILGYRTDGTPDSAQWPFAAYSPEYVALVWAARHEAEARFIDITVGQAIAYHGPDAPLPDDDVDLDQACAERRGMRSFEEFWEASFEAPRYDPGQFRQALLGYAGLVREAQRRPLDRVRDAVMAQAILEASSGTAPERIAVVVGAAHAAAFVAGDVDPSLANEAPAAVATAVTLIPFSFPRLAAQLGYGAGNRAPYYYQRAHDAGCDFRRATLEVLIDFTEHLRLRGFAASLADTIEAYRLAVTLAELRGKAEPGLDEVREGAIATLCRGDAAQLDRFLWPSVVGQSIGKVAAQIGKNSLQEEFWREVRARKLPDSDSPESFVLRLNNDVEVGTSIFLHRLRLAEVPYASYAGSQAVRGAPGAEEPGGFAALSRVRESWEAQWTPATDAALVEKIVLGDTLEQVVTRHLEAKLAEATTTGLAAEVLVESVVAGCAQTAGTALAACDRLAALDDALPSLAGACRALSGLASFGSSRRHADTGDEAIKALCVKTFARAVLRVREACTGSDEAVRPACDALRILHEVALGQPLVDKPAWLGSARELVTSYTVNPMAAGLGAGLLYLAEALAEDEVALIVGQRLSNTSEPLAAAGFLEGFLSVNALVLVRSRPVVKALDAFLVALPADRFVSVLPVLRRALGPLGATERRYLLETIVAVRGLGSASAEAKSVIDENDKEKLKAMSAELSGAMDDLDDLL